MCKHHPFNIDFAEITDYQMMENNLSRTTNWWTVEQMIGDWEQTFSRDALANMFKVMTV